MKASTWLRDAAELLAGADIPSALLDAEIILAHTLRKSRTWLHAHSDEVLTERELEIAGARLDLRLDHTPLAYIIGHKEFYGRPFKVTPSVLIPRPETEGMISLVNTLVTHDTHTLVDVGTGSGCVGITAKLEHPALSVTLVDISRHALTVAAENAKRLHADVTCQRGNLLDTVSKPTDIITANLPYVDSAWECSPETRYEPSIALFAKDAGLELIKRLIVQSITVLSKRGVLILEADLRQHTALIRYATEHHLQLIAQDSLIVAFQRQES